MHRRCFALLLLVAACGRSDLDLLPTVGDAVTTTLTSSTDANVDWGADARVDTSLDAPPETGCLSDVASPAPNGGYLETCTGCSVLCGSLRCDQCQTAMQVWVTTPPLALPCGGQVENCNGALTCVTIASLYSCFPPGSYSGSCENCYGDGQGDLWCAGCLTSGGSYIAASYTGGYCAAGIVACNGVLRCGSC